MSQSERGRPGTIRALAWMALTFGRGFARLLLHPVAAYFLLFSVEAKAASRTYLARVLGRKPQLADLYRHYYTFAAVILDRVYLLNSEYGRFEVRVFEADAVQETIEGGKGGFLLGAHMGSFEVMRSLGRHSRGLTVRMVMYEENAKKLNDVLESINPALAHEIIGLGRIDSMLRLERALADGEFVGMLADRTIADEGTIAVPFLGAPAQFPLGPFRIAAIMGRPVFVMFGLYRGGNRYDLHFEPLVDLSGIARAERDAMIERAVLRYVERLEHYCRLAPYNWFNFYDFWR
jgi:predicted LPLAT superfamily acyltransferase